MEKENIMKWEIDTKTKHLSLDGNYHISFDRLTEDDWFRHLAEKNWVDMKKILPAFVAAYDAAGLKLDKDFFARYKEAFFNRSEDDFRRSLSGVWNEKCNGGVILMSVSNLFRTPDDFIDDLISHKEPVDA
tara:strand:+ start:48 stop:440 length:393 start_codon:yes stop_codon:yes gene_type:complete